MKLGLNIGIGKVRKGALLNLDADYEKIYNAYVAKPSSLVRNVQNDFLVTLKSRTYWDKLDFLFNFRSHTNDNGEALIDWKNPETRSAILNGGVTFEQYMGFSGDGTTGFIDTNYNPSLSTKYTLNDASGGVWCNSSSGNTGVIMGSSGTGSLMFLLQLNSGGSTFARMNQAVGVVTATVRNETELFTLNRTASNSVGIYRNGIQFALEADVSGGEILNKNIYLLAQNSAGGAASFDNRQISFAYAGSSLTPTEMSTLRNDLFEYVAFTIFINEFAAVSYLDNADIDAMVGSELLVFNDAVSETRLSDEPVNADYVCDVGVESADRFSLTPTDASIEPISIDVTATRHADISTSINQYNPSGTGSKIILMIGDSLGAQGFSTRAQMESTLSHLTFDFIGTESDGTYLHEGISGAKFSTFLNSTSPFWDTIIYDANIPKYFTDNLFSPPDFVHIRLGINESLEASTQSTGFTTGQLATVLYYAKVLVDKFLAYDAGLKIIIGIPTLCENTGDGWNANYDESVFIQDYYIKAINQLRTMLSFIYKEKRYDNRVFISVEGYSVDRNDGYPKTGGIHTNGVHCSELGYQQIGKSISYTINAILAGK